MTTDLLTRSRDGDDQAFAELIEPYRRELLVHCYRMLGSAADAEDALQETMLAAWRGLVGFEERASVRTWLYQVATRCCLQAMRTARRRPQTDWPPPGLDVPAATRMGEVTWLEPIPDSYLAGLPDSSPSPEARYEARETISLAFVTALQSLPARQRAALILRDVLDFRAGEVAALLDSTEESVTSALKRARASMRSGGRRDAAPPASSEQERELLERLARAYESSDIDALVSMLTEDVLLAMPPIPLEFIGLDVVRSFLAAVVFGPGIVLRVAATRANGQPALAMYQPDPSGTTVLAGLLVFTLAGNRVCAITRFPVEALSLFSLPAELR